MYLSLWGKEPRKGLRGERITGGAGGIQTLSGKIEIRAEIKGLRRDKVNPQKAPAKTPQDLDLGEE